MLNYSLQNIMMRFNPQVQNQMLQLHERAMRSGNPEQVIAQYFGNSPAYTKALEVKNGKSETELNTYLGNVYNSMNR